MCVQNLKFVALLVPEIVGVLPKFGQSLNMPPFPFLQNFEWTFIRMNLNVSHQPNLQSVALPVPEIIAIEVLGVANSNLGKRRP